jgi:hypothetical protein
MHLGSLVSVSWRCQYSILGPIHFSWFDHLIVLIIGGNENRCISHVRGMLEEKPSRGFSRLRLRSTPWAGRAREPVGDIRVVRAKGRDASGVVLATGSAATRVRWYVFIIGFGFAFQLLAGGLFVVHFALSNSCLTHTGDVAGEFPSKKVEERFGGPKPPRTQAVEFNRSIAVAGSTHPIGL